MKIGYKLTIQYRKVGRSLTNQFLLLAVLIAVTSYNVTNQSICEPLREFICAYLCAGKKEHKIYKMVSCPYCFAHWVAGLFVVLTGFQFHPFHGYGWRAHITPVVNFLATVAALVVVAMIIMTMIDFLIDGINSLGKIINAYIKKEGE